MWWIIGLIIAVPVIIGLFSVMHSSRVGANERAFGRELEEWGKK